jgi:hypothetical protein
MRKRWLVVAGALALVGMASIMLYCWAVSPAPGVTEENFHRLRMGMTDREVEVLFGRPADDSSHRQRRWNSEKAIVFVSLDEQGRVSHACIFDGNDQREPVGLREVSLWDRLRAWLGW